MTLGCAAASQAHAQSWFQFEAGIGESFFSTRGNGVWYQEGFPYSLKLNFPAIEAGITGDLYQRDYWGISYHLDYVWLGRVSSDAWATSDENYDQTRHTCIRACTGSNRLARFVGTGTAQGVYLTIEPHLDYKGWRLGVEAGPFLNISRWTETVYDWNAHTVDGGPNVFQVHNNAAPQLSWVLGTSIAYKSFTLTYQYFMTNGRSSETFPAIWHGTHVLMVKYRF